MDYRKLYETFWREVGGDDDSRRQLVNEVNPAVWSLVARIKDTTRKALDKEIPAKYRAAVENEYESFLDRSVAYGYLLARVASGKTGKGKPKKAIDYEKLAERCRGIFFPEDDASLEQRNSKVPWEVWECMRAVRDLQLAELAKLLTKLDDLSYGKVKKISNYLYWGMMNAYFISVAEEGK
jgi:hypothetical protein